MAHRLLLDVSSLGYRAHFALRDSVRAPDGGPIGAVHGYLDMVTRLVASRHTDEVVHVYDHDWRPVVRTDLYPGYKASGPESATTPGSGASPTSTDSEVPRSAY